MTAILRDASGEMHHGILFDPPLCKRVTAEIGSVKRLYRACVMLLYSAKV